MSGCGALSKAALSRPPHQLNTAAACSQAQHNDVVLVDAPEGYENLWRKVRQLIHSCGYA